MLLGFSSAFAVTITYDFNGGQLPNGQTSYQIDSGDPDTVILENPVRTEGNVQYIFDGWCEDYDYVTDTCPSTLLGVDPVSGNVVWTVPNDLTTDTTFTAVWTPVTKTITWMNGENPAAGNMASEYVPGRQTLVDVVIPTKSGSLFVGWCLSGESDADCFAANNNGNQVAPKRLIADTLTGDLVFYARWITLMDDDTTFADTTSAEIDTESELGLVGFIMPFPADLANGVVFVGWCLQGESDDVCSAKNTRTTIPGAVVVVREIDATSISDLTFYARYETCADTGLGMVPNADRTQCECASVGTKWSSSSLEDITTPRLYDFGDNDKACVIDILSSGANAIAALTVCKYNASTGDYDTCTQTVNICDADAMDAFTDLVVVADDDEILAQRNFMGLSDWTDFFDENIDYSEIILMTDAILAQDSFNSCLFMTCPAGSYLKVVNDEPTGVQGTVWPMDNNKYAYCTDCGTAHWCPGGTWNGMQGSDQGHNECPTGYNVDNGTPNESIADCTALCPETPVCVDYVDNGAGNCHYVAGIETVTVNSVAKPVKHFGGVCATEFTTCVDGYNGASLGSWLDSNGSAILENLWCPISGTNHNCQGIQWNLRLKAGSPVSMVTGTMSCNAEEGDNLNRIDASKHFVPTGEGKYCWVKVFALDGMEVNANWVYLSEYADAETCAKECPTANLTPAEVSAAMMAVFNTIDVVAPKANICMPKDDIPINWGGVTDAGVAGTCTYDSIYTAPDQTAAANIVDVLANLGTLPAYCGENHDKCVFLGWKAPETSSGATTPTEPEPTGGGD